MKIQFHGALSTVTGSLHILETTRGELILLECGLFQGRRADAQQRNRALPVAPGRVKAVILSHAHVDHIGNLPTWHAQGLRCPVIGTSATVDLAALLLRDCAHIQVLDALFFNKHMRRNGQAIEPLYTPEIAEAAIGLMRPWKYREWFQVIPGVRAFFHDAGHILGSAAVTVEESVNGTSRRVCFTGDVGRPDTPILRDPEPFLPGADAVITESTYGNRDHAPQSELPEALRRVIYQTIARGGRVLIPAFAVGRTQAVLYALRQLQKAGKLPEVPVYLDSPLAQNATEVFRKHAECLDEPAAQVLKDDGVLFALEGYKNTRTKEESQALNEKREPCIILAGSGMCEAGRILHHLRHGLGDPRNTVLIVGFQAENTLGQRLVNGEKTVRIFGQETAVRAEVLSLNGFSAHAGQHELLAYLDRARPAGPAFLVHGEASRIAAFKTFLDGQGFPDVRIPAAGDTYKC
jgi:metallo-beta-lactamase family protein